MLNEAIDCTYKLVSSVSAVTEEWQQLMAGEAGIKTHCEQTCLCLRSLDGDLTEVMYTGSYSTRRGGMITTGCPDSSPHTPVGLKELKHVTKFTISF